MRAIVIRAPGGPDQLVIEERPDPAPAPEQVVIRVKAFGLNHAEAYFRSGIWPGTAVTGIECVGEVVADPSGRLAPGRRVCALMGGMGRTIDGSYAELTRVPAAQVVPLDTDLGWAELAALPESYATAWTCLHRNLGLTAGQALPVRGGTSALGQAAINIAVAAGARVLATTRDPARFATLAALGAEPVRDAPDLAAQIGRLDGALDLVGSSVLRDSLRLVRPDGRVCMAGFLGGGGPIDGFDPLADLPSGVHLSFFASAFAFGTADYPLSAVPFQDFADKAAAGIYQARPARVFRFDEIQDAHRLMEAGANGKIVVCV